MPEGLNRTDDTSWTVNERVRDVLDYSLIWGGLLMAATGILGEILGWWGELGLVLTAGGFLAGILGAIDVNGRALLGIVRPMASSIDGLHDKQDLMLDKQAMMLERQGETVSELVRIADLLDQRLPE